MNEIVPALEVRSAALSGGAAIELSVVIPTFKESGNIEPLLRRLDAALADIAWEAIFVDDDSPDGTGVLVKSIAASNPRVRCLRRVGRRGLAGACIEGMLSSAASYVAVMDADLQHDETLLRRMLERLRSGASDMVVGSRYVAGGNADALSKSRGALSRLATALTRGGTGTALSDPMSGFFMMRRESFDPLAGRLSADGFKILLDIVLTSRGGLRIAEEPYVFAERAHGESKLDAQVALDFLGLLLTKLTGSAVPPRFFSFLLVGGTGIGVHLLTLRLALAFFGQGFAPAQALATIVAMTSNFFLNNVLTYRDRRLSGAAMLKGLLGFYAVSAVGAVANVSIASWLYANDQVWWVAGIAGALMSAVWNFALSTLFVWRAK